MLALPLVALLGQVAKVDIRTGGTLTSDAILAGLLKAAYAGAGLDVATEHMTVMHDAMAGSYVIEVHDAGDPHELDAYWCANDPALRNGFKDLVGQTGITGLTDVTDVVTCVGAPGEGCASSTVCGSGGGGGGGGGSGGTEEPEPETGGGDTKKKDDDDDKLSTTVIVLITIGALVTCALLACIVWPYIESCWTQSAPKSEPIMGPITPTPSGVALPTLFNAV
jgi:hypothetical protein